MHLLGKGRSARVRRQWNNPGVDVGRHTRINQTQTQSRHRNERVVDAIKPDRRHRPDVRDRISIAHILEWPGVSRLSVAAAQHRLIVQAERETHPRQKQLRSTRTSIERHAALAAGQDLSRVRIEAVDAGIVFSRHREAFPAEPIG